MFHLARHLLSNRPRLLIGIALGLVVGLLLPFHWHWVTRLLVGWNIGIYFYLMLIMWLMVHAEPHHIRRLAEQEDKSNTLVVLTLLFAAFISFCAIVMDLAGVKDLPHTQRIFHYGLAAATIASSWLLTGVIFTLYYARTYYRTPNSRPLEFQGNGQHPDYWDFLYFSFSIACAAATSDTNVGTRTMRQIVLAQSVISFLFNLAIFGLSINIAAGVLAG